METARKSQTAREQLDTSLRQHTIPDHTINEKINFIKENAGIKEKVKKSDLKNGIIALTKLAEWYGLDIIQLEEVLDLVLSSKFDDEADNKRLVKLLIPRDKVQEMTAIKILGYLGHSPLKFATQALLLRWVVIVYNILDNHKKLQQLYGVIFHYLENDLLRPTCCHLLYYMTQREHIKPHRIRKLIDLQNRIGPEPPLIGLLTIYKDYFPNLVPTVIPKSTKATFKCPDIEWQQSIDLVQKRWSSEAGLLAGVSRRTTMGPSASKKRKTHHAETSQARTLDVTEESISLEEIANFRDLASKIDKLELPSQLALVLNDRTLQHMVACNPEQTTKARITHWLYQRLMDLLYWNDQTPETREKFGDLLSRVVKMTEFMKELLPVFDDFLAKYIQYWDGRLYQEHIFKLLEYVQPEPFDDFYNNFLKPLQKIFRVSSVIWKTRLLRCYTALLRHWVLLHWRLQNRQRTSVDHQENMEVQLGQVGSEAELVKSINGFVIHVDRIALLALEIENDNVEIQHAVLLFHEALSSLQSEYSWDKIIIPSSATVYRCFFSTSGMPLSRICGVVLQYKEAFDRCERRAAQRGLVRHSRDYVNYFNSFVMDLCNCLWRNRPFNKIDRNSRGFQLEDEIIKVIKEMCGEEVASCFSLTYLPALVAYSRKCFEELEESSPNITRRLNRPVTYAALKENENLGGSIITYSNYRVLFLDYLLAKGFVGLHAFLYQSLTSLANSRHNN